jgi:hypothetical protein
MFGLIFLVDADSIFHILMLTKNMRQTLQLGMKPTFNDSSPNWYHTAIILYHIGNGRLSDPIEIMYWKFMALFQENLDSIILRTSLQMSIGQGFV